MYRKKSINKIATATTTVYHNSKMLEDKYRIQSNDTVQSNRYCVISWVGNWKPFRSYSPFVCIIWMWHFYYRMQWNHLLYSIQCYPTDTGHWTFDYRRWILDIRTVVVILNTGQNKLKTNYRLLSTFVSPFFLTQFLIWHSDNYYLLCNQSIGRFYLSLKIKLKDFKVTEPLSICCL